MNTNQKQDGIEERDNRSLMRSRPREVCRVCGSIDVHTDTYGQPTMKCIGYISHIGNEARAETATLTANFKKALADLIDAARTSGGVAGRDDALCLACEKAEKLL